MSVKNGSKTLIGLNSILDYMDISRPMFIQFVQMGLPARVINNRWYAHKENIDDFFKSITRHREKDIPADAEQKKGDYMPSKIEWTDETWNPVTGCSKISEGCKNCYAERMAKRLAGRYGYTDAGHNYSYASWI